MLEIIKSRFFYKGLSFKRGYPGILFYLAACLLLAACGEITATPPGVNPTFSPVSTTQSAGTATPVILSSPVTGEASTTLPSPSPTASSLPFEKTTLAPTSTVTPPGVPATRVPPGGTATAASSATFSPAKCPFELAADQVEGKTVNCGYVTVPEFHANPGGRKLKLAVAVFKSLAANPAPEPVIYLEGGPGGHIETLVSLITKNNPILNEFYKAMAGRGDAIFFDQRGVGKSEPALACPETLETAYQTANLILTPQEGEARYLEALNKCRDRLASQGINLDAYNTVENAADVNDIRAALGYQKLNLVGSSYGTLLAQTIMRQTPGVIRSVVLDSVVPPDTTTNFYAPATGTRSLNLIFQACAADTACNQLYPDLKNVFSKTLARLNSNPITVSLTNSNDNKTFDAKVNGITFYDSLFLLVYSTREIPRVPEMIYKVYNGDYSDLPDLLIIPYEEDKEIDEAMHYAVKCSGQTEFPSQQEIETINRDDFAEVKPDLLAEEDSFVSVCRNWNIKHIDPAQNTPLKSDLPTLLLEGQFDPITPPDYGKRVAAGLNKSFLVEFPYSGHGEAGPGSSCGLSVMASFIADPLTRPDSSCTSRLTLKFNLSRAGGLNIAPIGIPQINDFKEVPVDQSIAKKLVAGSPLAALGDLAVNLFTSGESADKVAQALHQGLLAQGYKFAIPGQSQPVKDGNSYLGMYTKEGKPDLRFRAQPLPTNLSQLYASGKETSSDNRQKFEQALKGRTSFIVISSANNLVKTVTDSQ